jgi:hypothetical protein
MNALPITELPEQCQSLTFRSPKEWADLRTATRNTEGALIFTKGDAVLCWGNEQLIHRQFSDLASISPYDLTPKIADIDSNLHIKGFLEEAICQALIRSKPLLTRTTRQASFLIADAHSSDQSAFAALRTIVGKISGDIVGLFAPIDAEHPHPVKVSWSEAIRISIDKVDGRTWLLLDPDIWIWPHRARKEATAFLDERRANRYNKLYNALVNAWLGILLGKQKQSTEIAISTSAGGTVVETPSFSIGFRTAYTRRLAS